MTDNQIRINELKNDLEQKQIDLNNFCQTSAQDISALKLMLDEAYKSSDFKDKEMLFEKIVDAQERMRVVMQEIIRTNQEIANLSTKNPNPELNYYFVTVLFCVAFTLMESYSMIAVALGFISLVILGMQAKDSLTKSF
jgi:negative regulator of genetic competence, sporulation and motility